MQYKTQLQHEYEIFHTKKWKLNIELLGIEQKMHWKICRNLIENEEKKNLKKKRKTKRYKKVQRETKKDDEQAKAEQCQAQDKLWVLSKTMSHGV